MFKREDIPKFRRKSFGILAELKDKFDAAGITDEDFWSLVKIHFNIMRRRNLGDHWWEISHILECIQNEQHEFDQLVDRVNELRRSIRF